MDEQFLRTRMILGADAVERLRCSHVIVFGLGGVGSYAAEALARAGVGELTLVDQDTLSVSNINRQLYALHSTVGMYKADVAAARCLDINPALRVHPVCATYDAAHREDFFTARYDYIVDAIDLVSCKLDLVEQARERGIPIISAMGTGNKLDPTLLTVTDLARTSGCPLARVMRRELRRRGIEHLQVVYSPEPPAEPEPLEEPSPGGVFVFSRGEGQNRLRMPPAGTFLSPVKERYQRTPPETGWFLDFLRAPRTFQVVGVRATRLGNFARGLKCSIVRRSAPLLLTVRNVGVQCPLVRAVGDAGPYSRKVEILQASRRGT